MRSHLIAFCILFCGYTLYGQSWISSNRLTGTDDINIIQSISDENNNTIVLGEYVGTISYNTDGVLNSYGMRDYYLSKFDSDGNLDWITSIGGTGNEFVYGGVGSDTDGNIYVSGGFRNDCFFTPTDSVEGFGKQDIFLAKYIADGTLDWYKNVGAGFQNQRPTTLSVNSSNNIILAGTFTDSIQIDDTHILYDENDVADYFYAEFDNTGTLIWTKQIKANNNPLLSGSIFGINSGDDHYTFTGVFADTSFIEDDTLVSLGDLDVHVFQTDLTGNLQWVRRIQGTGAIYSYSLDADPDGNTYVTGYYNCPSLIIDSTDTETITVNSNAGSIDIFVAKYAPDGTLQWIRTNGGPAIDKLFGIQYFDNQVHVSGHFTDAMTWGGFQLSTEGLNDQDMFFGSLDLDGNYRSANSTHGRNNSTEESYSIAVNADKLYTTIRSNSDLLVLGDSSYVSATGKFYIALGVYGCLPISIDQVVPEDITECFGDSTGTIEIVASGGFGVPYKYSVDNGLSYSLLSKIRDLPAGDHQVVVSDAANCTEVGPLVTLTQPDALILTVTDVDSVLCYGDSNGKITVDVTGGTGDYSYSIDSGQVYSDISILDQLSPAVYQVAVHDDEGCVAIAPKDTIWEPSVLTVIVDSIKHIYTDDPGYIAVSADGGTGTFTYTIMPADISQENDGTFYLISMNDETLYTYTVKVTDKNLCEVETASIDIEDHTSIEVLDGVLVKVYPNPTTGILTLELPYDKEDCLLEVLNLTGQLVMKKQIYSNGGMIRETLDLSYVSKGMYMLRIDGKSLKSAIIVN